MTIAQVLVVVGVVLAFFFGPIDAFVRKALLRRRSMRRLRSLLRALGPARGEQDSNTALLSTLSDTSVVLRQLAVELETSFRGAWGVDHMAKQIRRAVSAADLWSEEGTLDDGVVRSLLDEARSRWTELESSTNKRWRIHVGDVEAFANDLDGVLNNVAQLLALRRGLAEPPYR